MHVTRYATSVLKLSVHTLLHAESTLLYSAGVCSLTYGARRSPRHATSVRFSLAHSHRLGD
jgi:hypothetical protein